MFTSYQSLLLSLSFLLEIHVEICQARQGADKASLTSELAPRAVPSSPTFPEPGKCRCMPGDSCWPDTATWDAFNQTVDGRLIATTPIGAPCHDSLFASYNQTACAALQAQWTTPATHYESSSSIMQQFFANQSCDSFQPRSRECVVGTYVAYTVNATDYLHVARTIWFATHFNIRFVTRNSGHDYLGRSTGAGAIAVWVHYMKNITFAEYNSPHYKGKSYTVGAGVQTIDGYAAADAQGLHVVGGECQTTSIAGGYTQGGGHSSLATAYGLAADQTLEWEVVDGRGNLLVATPYNNSDLYWALSGGGGGTYGVVLSMTSKAYPKELVSGANLAFTSGVNGTTQDQFYGAISKFLTQLPTLIDAGLSLLYFLNQTDFSISPLTGINITADIVTDLLSPLTNDLTQAGIPYQSVVQQFHGFYDQYVAIQRPVPAGTVSLGGRLIPREVVTEQKGDLLSIYRNITANGVQLTGVCVNVSRSFPNNSVNVGWRNALVEQTVTVPYNFSAPIPADTITLNTITNDYVAQLEGITPGGSAYASEGAYLQPNFREVFYGSNYQALDDIKSRFDPYDVFYGLQNVGSERWLEQDGGRLCRI